MKCARIFQNAALQSTWRNRDKATTNTLETNESCSSKNSRKKQKRPISQISHLLFTTPQGQSRRDAGVTRFIKLDAALSSLHCAHYSVPYSTM